MKNLIIDVLGLILLFISFIPIAYYQLQNILFNNGYTQEQPMSLMDCFMGAFKVFGIGLFCIICFIALISIISMLVKKIFNKLGKLNNEGSN